MKACIIGAGLGGLATACLLAKKMDVDVYEKEGLLGGRALSCNASQYEEFIKKFEMKVIRKENFDGLDGYTLDLGFHLLGGGKRGACVRLLKELGINIDFVGSRLGFIGEKIDYPILKAKDKLAMLPRILQLLTTSKEEMEKMKKISMEEMIRKYGKGKLKLVLELFPRLITTVNDLSRISAGETFLAQRELLGGKPVVYPHNGIGKIAKELANYLEKNGGKIFLGKKVDKIIIENGVAKGIKVGNEEIPYDLIISTLPIQHIFTIANKEEFPDDWAEYVKNLKPTGSLVAYHALNNLDKKLLNKSFVFIERNVDFEGNDVVGMIDFKMHWMTNLAPKGKYIIQSYVICSPEEAKSKRKMEELAEILDKNLEKLLPNKKIEWNVYASIWHLDGVAKTIDCIKPNVATPVQDLYIAGDCVASKGVGMNCAIDSSRLIMEEVKKQYRVE